MRTTARLNHLSTRMLTLCLGGQFVIGLLLHLSLYDETGINLPDNPYTLLDITDVTLAKICGELRRCREIQQFFTCRCTMKVRLVYRTIPTHYVHLWSSHEEMWSTASLYSCVTVPHRNTKIIVRNGDKQLKTVKSRSSFDFKFYFGEQRGMEAKSALSEYLEVQWGDGRGGGGS